jgi:3,4-dihydroxy 2-butanone 4-phosphate synthase/GTP cyclohydrolase II
MRLLTNNPRKFIALEGYGLEITARVGIEIAANDVSAAYLRTKKERLGHLLEKV